MVLLSGRNCVALQLKAKMYIHPTPPGLWAAITTEWVDTLMWNPFDRMKNHLLVLNEYFRFWLMTYDPQRAVAKSNYMRQIINTITEVRTRSLECKGQHLKCIKLQEGQYLGTHILGTSHCEGLTLWKIAPKQVVPRRRHTESEGLPVLSRTSNADLCRHTF